MSRQIPPMPAEEDRHMMIYSQGNLEPERPEPPSRSPTPELPPNFVPKPPVESTSFPAANNIVSLLTRMSGGSSLRDLIIVPAATWDRNNTMWEHKMAQLRKKHRKDWAEKEVDLRRKYDEQYSDARYRELLLSKEMKEMEFARVVSDGVVFGKTWKEHKSAKEDMERVYTEQLEEKEKEIKENKIVIEKLRREVAEKEIAIETLQSAIGRKADRMPVEEPQRLEQPQHAQQLPQFQQLQQSRQSQTPKYQLSQLGPGMAAPGQGFSSTHNFFQQPTQPSLQYSPQQQQQNQQYQQKQQQGPRVVDQSMALVKTGPFGNTHNPSTFGHTSFGTLSTGNSSRVLSSITPSFSSVSGPNSNTFPPSDQYKQHGERVEYYQQGQDGKYRGNSRNSQGSDKYWKSENSIHGDNPSGSGRNSERRSENQSDNRLASSPAFSLDFRPDIIRLEPHHEHYSKHQEDHLNLDSEYSNSLGFAREDTTDKHVPSYLAQRQTSATPWADSFPTPQNRSIATKEPNTGVAISRQSYPIDTTPRPTSGFPGPFGPQGRLVTSSGSPLPSSRSAKNLASRPTISTRSSGERLDEAADKATLSHADAVVKEVLPVTGPGHGILKGLESRKSSGLRTVRFERSQKRPHSVSPPNRRVIPRAGKSQQLHSSENEVDQQRPRLLTSTAQLLGTSKIKAQGTGYPRDLPKTTMTEEDIGKEIDEIGDEYRKPDPAPESEEADDSTPEVDLKSYKDSVAKDLRKKSRENKRVVCITLKRGMAWSGPMYIMNKIRGGALEVVHVYDKEHEVFASFVKPSAAQKFYDFFNQNPDAKEAFIRFKMHVKWVTDSITEIDPDLAFSIASGATRCITVFQVRNDSSIEDVHRDFSSKKGSFEVLSVRFGTEERRRRESNTMTKFAIIEFYSIQLALDMKWKVEGNGLTGYQNCEVEFSDDPCEKKGGKLWPIDSMRTWPRE